MSFFQEKFVIRSWFLVLTCAFATVSMAAEAPSSPAAATAPAAVSKGQMLVGADGGRLGSVSRISADGSPQIILDGKLITVPVATLSMANGKLTTSLTKSQVLALP
jgi:hypothetical protein